MRRVMADKEMKSAMHTGRSVKLLRYFAVSGAALLMFWSVPAVEAKTWTVTTTADSRMKEGSLRYIVAKANGGDTILFSSGGANLTSEIVLDKSLALVGPATIKQTGWERVFSIPAGTTVTMENLTITGGSADYYGGGIYNEGMLTMTGCTVSDNRSARDGGGVYSGVYDYSTQTRTGTLTLTNCTVRNNAATFSGGGVFNGATMTSNGCAFSGNSAYWGGGLLMESNSHASISEGVIENNAATDGGGLFNKGYVQNIQGTSFKRNNAEGKGGAIYGSNGILTVTACAISANSAGSGGGGIYNTYIPGGRPIELKSGVLVTNNTPDQVNGYYVSDGSCIIGDAAGSKSVALSGFAQGSAPKPRKTSGESDVDAAEQALKDSGSDLFTLVKKSMNADLGASGEVSAALSGMNAKLYDAFAYENVPLADASGKGELVIEFTASWPERARYYAAFAECGDGAADALSVKGYVIAERGVQFEVKPGQPLPDGVTPPDFYEEGEGLMTWRNVVADNGPYDHNPAVGVVTFRVCSVRAEAIQQQNGGEGGCSVGGAGSAWVAALLFVPVFALARKTR